MHNGSPSLPRLPPLSIYPVSLHSVLRHRTTQGIFVQAQQLGHGTTRDTSTLPTHSGGFISQTTVLCLCGVVTCFAGGKPIICLFSHCISRRLGKAHAATDARVVCVCLRGDLTCEVLFLPDRRDVHKTGRWNMAGGGKHAAPLPTRSSPLSLSVTLPGNQVNDIKRKS